MMRDLSYESQIEQLRADSPVGVRVDLNPFKWIQWLHKLTSNKCNMLLDEVKMQIILGR